MRIRSETHFSHLEWTAVGMSSSHPVSRFLHRSCMILLAGKITGATNPRGSYNDDVMERIPRHVVGFSLLVMVNWKTSCSISHWIPNAGSIASPSWCMSRAAISLDCSVGGMLLMTS